MRRAASGSTGGRSGAAGGAGSSGSGAMCSAHCCGPSAGASGATSQSGAGCSSEALTTVDGRRRAAACPAVEGSASARRRHGARVRRPRRRGEAEARVPAAAVSGASGSGASSATAGASGAGGGGSSGAGGGGASGSGAAIASTGAASGGGGGANGSDGRRWRQFAVQPRGVEAPSRACWARRSRCAAWNWTAPCRRQATRRGPGCQGRARRPRSALPWWPGGRTARTRRRRAPPGARRELQPALISVAGVDGPVAAGFAACDFVPFAIGGGASMPG